jgi:hypothetical protein
MLPCCVCKGPKEIEDSLLCRDCTIANEDRRKAFKVREQKLEDAFNNGELCGYLRYHHGDLTTRELRMIDDMKKLKKIEPLRKW